MSKVKKLLLILIGVPVLLVVLLLVGLGLYLDPLAKRAVEKGATYALGVPTTLGSASVGIVSGKFGLSGLQVSNVAGFKEKNFLLLGDGRVDLPLMSLTKDTIVVPRFSLDTIEVNLEKKEGKANYQVIMDNLGKLSKGGQPESKPAGEGPGKKFIIHELTIRNVKVKADVTALTGAVTIPIEEIKLTDVGKGAGKGVADSGVTIEQLCSIIVQAVMKATAERGGGILPADILGDLKGEVERLGGLKDVGVQVMGKVGEAAKEIEKIGGDLEKQLKGILPKKK